MLHGLLLLLLLLIVLLLPHELLQLVLKVRILLGLLQAMLLLLVMERCLVGQAVMVLRELSVLTRSVTAAWRTN